MIDFTKLPVLMGPRRKQLLSQQNDKDKLVRISKGRKNHSVNREKAIGAQKKNQRLKHHSAANSKKIEARKKAIREYWLGEREDYPA